MIFSWITCLLLSLSQLSFKLCNALLEDGEGTLSNKRLGCINWNRKILETIARTKVVFPPDLSGQWVSESCETRDGPQYLLRSYTFDARNGTMNLLQIYYSDDSCTMPIYSLTANGTYTIESQTLSKNGIVELNYDLSRVTVIAHDSQTATDLAEKLNAVCPEVVQPKRWRHYREYEIYNKNRRLSSLVVEQNTVKRDNNANNLRPIMESNLNNSEQAKTEHLATKNDYQKCLSSLNINFNELQSVRMQIKPSDFKNSNSSERKELLFRGVYNSSFDREKTYLLPFQLPLVLPEENSKCYVCQHLMTSNAFHVPNLYAEIAMQFYLNGEWISTGCEMRVLDNFFQMKHIRINSNTSTWHTEYRVFSNYTCSHQLMMYELTGTFTMGTPYTNSRAFGIDFQINKATLMIKNSSILDIIRKDNLCNLPAYWKVGILKELPSKYGCTSIGIVTPAVRYDVAKVISENDGTNILFLGEQVELPPSGEALEVAKYRPTSYHYTLIQCSTHSFHLNSHSDPCDFNGNHHHNHHESCRGGANTIQKMLLLPNMSIIAIVIFHSFLYRR